jgi:hypothetical protein
MHQVEFEPTIPVFERTNTIHALYRAATVIGFGTHVAYVKFHIKVMGIFISTVFNINYCDENNKKLNFSSGFEALKTAYTMTTR